MALTVCSSFDWDVEKPGTRGATRTPGVYARINEVMNGAEPL